MADDINNNETTYTQADMDKLKDSYQTNLNKLNEENIKLRNTTAELQIMPQIEKTFQKAGGRKGNAFKDFYNMNKDKLLNSKDLTTDINALKLEKDYFFKQEKKEIAPTTTEPIPTPAAANVGAQVNNLPKPTTTKDGTTKFWPGTVIPIEQ